MKNVFIGTSGWFYDHWIGNFYPEDLKKEEWLHFFSGSCLTLEINTTFYHTPRESTVKNWYKQTPKNFRFSVKASGYITHRKRLHDCKNSLKYFFRSIKALKDKQGPILFQLPPSFKMNRERLEEFISHLESDHLYVFEFRHDSWYTEEIYSLLRAHNIALCITDLNHKQSPQVITASFTYLRLHGPKSAYKGSYSSQKLTSWKKQFQTWSRKGIAVYCYFDNDEKGYAIEDAKRLLRSMNRRSPIRII